MDEEAEVIEPTETEVVEVEQKGEPNVNDEEEETGLVVEIGSEDPEEEPEHITELRKRYREQQKRLKDLEAKVTQPAEAEALAPEPTMEDFDYDEPAFKAAWREWNKKNEEHEKRKAEALAVQERAEQKWKTRLAYYDEGKEKLGASDYDEAEATVAEILAPGFPGIVAEDVRLGIIKQGAKDPAALVYALGKNPAKAKELAAIDDPVEFAWKCAALEATMKVTVRGKAPPPEKRVSGGVPGVSGALDDTLERLRAEAAKTGDYSKVLAYKKQHKG